ncbi:hypothetical protein RFI_10497 [Reticulomyxa filosa]|uniref:Uncharacterized protein n=1 Tax=Reticulomyxa filosa TaxID=46433 RepID=X6NL43_RETFI|nr:hypothetical protein RFI_10497 [Reticulomyxa filosa]|eukprot:ETO26638.1 hypothetical protein RFI_10497 [Reticulomyxa filosa]
MGQFQFYMKKICVNELQNETINKRIAQLPENLPKSVLVFDEQGINSKIEECIRQYATLATFPRNWLYFKIVAFNLFQKYVRVGAEKKLSDLMQNKLKWLLDDYRESSSVSSPRSGVIEMVSIVSKVENYPQLFHIFDDCISQMYVFMRQSLTRFSLSD